MTSFVSKTCLFDGVLSIAIKENIFTLKPMNSYTGDCVIGDAFAIVYSTYAENNNLSFSVTEISNESVFLISLKTGINIKKEIFNIEFQNKSKETLKFVNRFKFQEDHKNVEISLTIDGGYTFSSDEQFMELIFCYYEDSHIVLSNSNNYVYMLSDFLFSKITDAFGVFMNGILIDKLTRLSQFDNCDPRIFNFAFKWCVAPLCQDYAVVVLQESVDCRAMARDLAAILKVNCDGIRFFSYKKKELIEDDTSVFENRNNLYYMKSLYYHVGRSRVTCVSAEAGGGGGPLSLVVPVNYTVAEMRRRLGRELGIDATKCHVSQRGQWLGDEAVVEVGCEELRYLVGTMFPCLDIE